MFGGIFSSALPCSFNECGILRWIQQKSKETTKDLTGRYDVYVFSYDYCRVWENWQNIHVISSAKNVLLVYSLFLLLNCFKSGPPIEFSLIKSRV